MGKFITEFKEFIQRGNVMDMAVGVIIGSSFKAIADSLSNDILMPVLGGFMGEVSFSDLSFQLGNAVITYGNFLQAILSFLLMAFAVFCLVKGINSLRRKNVKEADPTPPAPSAEEALLAEIRDLLREK